MTEKDQIDNANAPVAAVVNTLSGCGMIHTHGLSIAYCDADGSTHDEQWQALLDTAKAPG